LKKKGKCFYRYCKFVKFPSWVGIVPDNWLSERYLWFFFPPSNWKYEKLKIKWIMILTAFVTLLSFQIQLELYLKELLYLAIYFSIINTVVIFHSKKKRRREYNWVILLGFDESQVTPVWTHKSFITFQFKFPFDVNEL